jgi:hypothetical protein
MAADRNMGGSIIAAGSRAVYDQAVAVLRR